MTDKNNEEARKMFRKTIAKLEKVESQSKRDIEAKRKRKMRSEQAIQKQIIKYLQSYGAFTHKVIEANVSGIPDIIACLDGKYLAIEVKKEGGKVSKLQEQKIRMIKQAGGVAFVAYSLKEAKEELRKEFGI